MASLIEPEKSELSYRKKWHKSAKTMAYLGKTEPFPKEEWESFMENTVKADPLKKFYRLVFCPGCNDFTAETEWEYSDDLKGYLFSILVRGDMRRIGYGKETLRLMKLEAAEHDIHKFYC